MFPPGQSEGAAVKGYAEAMAAGTLTGWHSHPRAQLVLSLAGTLACATDDGTWMVPTDRAVWIPAGRRHCLSAPGDVATRSLYLRPDLWDGGAHCRVLALTPLLKALVLRFSDPDAADDDGTGAAAERRLAVLLDELAAAPEAPLGLLPGSDRRLRRVTDNLGRSPEDGRSLAEWARAAGASERTLARLFRAETGLSFADWRRRARLFRALSLLAAGESVTAVALSLGYAGPSAFIQAFRRAFGETPGQVGRRRAAD